MSVTGREPAGLPNDGPAVLAAVKLQLSIPAADTGEDDRLEPVVAAVNAMVRELPVARRALLTDPAAWPAYVEHGAVMLAARVYRRRNSPAGVEAISADGAVYVMRNDPDIADMLLVGRSQLPGIG